MQYYNCKLFKSYHVSYNLLQVSFIFFFNNPLKLFTKNEKIKNTKTLIFYYINKKY